ncbi:MAG: radical SAM family heme chaperone HemW [Candidatus Makana argininalis]
MNLNKLPKISLYIHIPWCIKKCHYCDFNSFLIKKKIPYKQYIKNLLEDLDNDIKYISGRNIHTIFIGGGTPSLFPLKSIKILIKEIKKRFLISDKTEITLETNPESSSNNLFYEYKKIGINRISIGIQTLDKNKLFNLGRINNHYNINLICKLIYSKYIKNFNFDLMYGLPNQSISESIKDLNNIIYSKPDHISWYQLTIEPNTYFYYVPPILPNENNIWKMYKLGNNILKKSGYLQYEISSYAKEKKFRCKHNINYWKFGDYIGIGCGSHGKITLKDGTVIRIMKSRNIINYMNKNYIYKIYNVDYNNLIIEYFMNRFRLSESIPRSEFYYYTGIKEINIRKSINKAIKKKYIKENDLYWTITDFGKLFLNFLIELFI